MKKRLNIKGIIAITGIIGGSVVILNDMYNLLILHGTYTITGIGTAIATYLMMSACEDYIRTRINK